MDEEQPVEEQISSVMDSLTDENLLSRELNETNTTTTTTTTTNSNNDDSVFKSPKKKIKRKSHDDELDILDV